MMFLRILFGVALGLSSAYAFQSRLVGRESSPLFMAPKYDKKAARWVPTASSDEAGSGYGIGKTLLLRGPKPFLHRLFQPDDYEQAVLKCEYCACDMAAFVIRFLVSIRLTLFSSSYRYDTSHAKVMAMEKCDRIEAQGNMDAYLENAQGTKRSRADGIRQTLLSPHLSLVH